MHLLRAMVRFCSVQDLVRMCLEMGKQRVFDLQAQNTTRTLDSFCAAQVNNMKTVSYSGMIV